MILLFFLFPRIIFQSKFIKKIDPKCIFLEACIKNASKMHKIGYMTPPRGSQDASRTPQDGFCFRFGRQLGAILGTFFRPRRPRRPPRRPKMPNGNGGGMVRARDTHPYVWLPNMKITSRRFWADFGAVLAWFWQVFGRFFGAKTGQDASRCQFFWICSFSFSHLFSFAFSRRLKSPTVGSKQDLGRI